MAFSGAGRVYTGFSVIFDLVISITDKETGETYGKMFELPLSRYWPVLGAFVTNFNHVADETSPLREHNILLQALLWRPPRRPPPFPNLNRPFSWPNPPPGARMPVGPGGSITTRSSPSMFKMSPF